MARHEDSDEDTFATVGTPFKVLETAEDVQKAKERKDKEQYVTDSQGRRRFHGAFTGGFSAGYYNTVGSKEGWAPSAFRSSRGSKTEFSGQRPEDFMDEEDLGTHGIAPREVATRSHFSLKGAGPGVKRPHPLDETRPTVIPGEAPLQNVIVPAKSSVGAHLLRSMGWREGQGVGPRTQRNTTTGTKVYGCSLPSQGTTSSSNFDHPGPPESEMPPEEVQGFLFAPRDVRVRQFEGKDDLHGIGYRGMEERGILGGKETSRALYGMRGEAFGIGALEEEDTEDHVYGVESMTSYNVTITGEGDMEMERKFGWTGGVEDAWSLASFKKAARPPPKLKVYRSPDVPRDFVPIHRFSILNIKTSEGQEAHSKPVTVSERSQLLADKPGSVFSLLSAEDREKLKRVSGVVQTPQPLISPATSQNVSPALAQARMPHLPSTPPFSRAAGAPIGLQAPPPALQKPSPLGDIAIKSIKPFAYDPAKQARYEAFQSGQRLHSDPVLVGMTEWERQRERGEFARTSSIYQPLSVSLNSRFTKEQGKEEAEKPKSPEPDSVQAARANLFGVLTRQVLEWHPHRVLCKRFNVPDPYPNSGLVGVVNEKDKQLSATKHIQFLPMLGKTESSSSSSTNHPQNVVPGNPQGTTFPEGLLPPGTENENIAVAKNAGEEKIGENIAAKSDENAEEERATRPPMDLFKAIFAESSSESDVSSDSEGEAEPQKSGSIQDEAAAASTQETSSLKPPEAKRKTRWQDWSTVTAKPLPIIAKTQPSVDNDAAEKMTRTLSSVAAVSTAVDREGGGRDGNRSGEDATGSERKPPNTFGPVLPPGFGNEVASDSDQPRHHHHRGRGEAGSEEERKHSTHSRHAHKHKHHKTAKKEKKDKYEEDVRHRRKEKKSKHKH